ncbi:hypothetical protein COY23_04425 [bacterium (Candidatus Torokbacteria) CG_4_10_14_0_2_um_filter_35_8]|nr:MAG: hypothetical protein COY23_04425 [bacterium (Candidatus Torokbacteria) CG_4_10_14_0_2_um_filter_35_8]
MRKILLHICCAPCLTYTLKKLRNNKFKVEGYFYNPNIHGFLEYKKRLIYLLKYSKKVKLPLSVSREDYDNGLRKYFEFIGDHKDDRCPICYWIRLEETAKLAKKKKIKFFSTTLLISPYQDQELLKKIGGSIAKKYKLKFYYDDFKKGYRESRRMAKKEGLYMQKYCGCIFSEFEKYERCGVKAKR